jgi:hypothetical protein
MTPTTVTETLAFDRVAAVLPELRRHEASRGEHPAEPDTHGVAPRRVRIGLFRSGGHPLGVGGGGKASPLPVCA